MEIRTEKPPEYGQKVLYREIPSTYDVKNSLLDEVLGILREREFLDGADDEVWARLCLDEVIVNAIKHGNQEDLAKIVRVSLFIDEKLWAIRVEDEGDGFTVDKVASADESLENELEHNRGATLVGNYMDEVWYYDNGASVQLKKEKKSVLRKLLHKMLVFLKLKDL